jgi:hypothetical protein
MTTKFARDFIDWKIRNYPEDKKEVNFDSKLCKLARRIDSEYYWISQHEDVPDRIEFDVHVRHYERLQTRYFKTHQRYYNPITRVRERILGVQ